MILITTSHRPTKGMRTLCRDLACSMPDLIRVNRGKMSLLEVAEKASELGAEKMVIIDRWKDGQGRIRLFKTRENLITQVPPAIYIKAIKLRREFKTARKPTRSLFIDGADEGNHEIKRLKESLSDFLGIPIIDIKDASAEYQTIMRFSKEPSRPLQISFHTLNGNIEIGPRITISHGVWET